MKKSTAYGVVVGALLVASYPTANADELGHDICFAPGSETLASLGCGMMKSETDKAIAAQPRWRQMLLGKTRVECYPIAQDSGTWHIFTRGQSEQVESRQKDSGLLGALVTPTKPMVCVDWSLSGFQTTVETIMLPLMESAFFDFEYAGVRLQRLEVRTN